MLPILGLIVVLILVVGLIAAFTGAFGVAPRGPVDRAGADDELVVATFNVRNGRAWDGRSSWIFRGRATARMARELGADVLGIQEAFSFQNRFLGSSLPGYELVGRGRSARGGEWCSIFVRTDRLRVVGAATRWFGDEPDRPGARLPDASFPRIGTHVRLSIAGLAAEGAGAADAAVELELVNTHLDERSAANRLRSVEQLVDWLDPAVPRIVMGDLNATWEREPEMFAVLTDAGLVDALPDDAGGTTHNFKGVRGRRRIDHIFVSRDWEVTGSSVVVDERTSGFPSDHWPVVARLRLR